MSFLKRLAASIGIGSAEVETVLEKSTYLPGEQVRGTVHVKGGSVEQAIDDINLYLMISYFTVQTGQSFNQVDQIDKYLIVPGFAILPGEYKSFPFHFPLPLHTPASMEGCAIWMETDVAKGSGVAADNRHLIHVQMHRWVEKILSTVVQCGFTLVEATCKRATFFQRRVPFVQQFRFGPDPDSFHGNIQTMELVCQVEENGVKVALRVDGGQWGEADLMVDSTHDEDSFVCTHIPAEEIAKVDQQEVQRTIERMIASQIK